MQAASEMMARDHQALLAFEQKAANASSKVPLAEALETVLTPPVRLLLLCYEEDAYSARSPSGSHLLNGLLQGLPDSKLIEDIHSTLRNDQRASRNRKQTLHNMQQLVSNSTHLESRKIEHRAQINKDQFLAGFPKTRDSKRLRRRVMMP